MYALQTHIQTALWYTRRLLSIGTNAYHFLEFFPVSSYVRPLLHRPEPFLRASAVPDIGDLACAKASALFGLHTIPCIWLHIEIHCSCADIPVPVTPYRRPPIRSENMPCSCPAESILLPELCAAEGDYAGDAIFLSMIATSRRISCTSVSHWTG